MLFYRRRRVVGHAVVVGRLRHGNRFRPAVTINGRRARKFRVVFTFNLIIGPAELSAPRGKARFRPTKINAFYAEKKPNSHTTAADLPVNISRRLVRPASPSVAIFEPSRQTNHCDKCSLSLSLSRPPSVYMRLDSLRRGR